jgi:Predicted N-acetylglucosaminyl transferase
MSLDLLAFTRAADVYRAEFQKKPADLGYLDLLFPHLQLTLDWFFDRSDAASLQALTQLLLAIAPYLEARSYPSIALKYLPACLKANDTEFDAKVKLLLIAYQANFMAGEWEKAKEMAEAAQALSADCDLTDEALTYKSLAILELNQGDFQPAMKNFSRAKEIFRELGNENQLFAVTSQEAAYYLNKENYLKAEELYKSVEAHEITASGAPSPHTLLMMGVISRRLKQQEKAIRYLHELAELGLENHSRSDLATGLHHLAWVLIDQGQLAQAWAYGEAARKIYIEIDDPRGVSDADEQLGEIAALQGQYTISQGYFQNVVRERRRLENKVGLASASRRLSKVLFKQKRVFSGVFYLIYSTMLYARLGMLTRERLKRWLHNP